MKLVECFHVNTWFSIEGIASVAATTQGAMAGSAIGDLVFTIVMCKVLAVIRNGFVEAGIAVSVDNPRYDPGDSESPEQFRLVDISFVDDGLFPIIAPAEQLLANASEALAVIEMAFTMHGLIVNTSAGKTEVLVDYAGPKAEQLREHILYECNSSVSYQGVQQERSVNIVHVYPHVGTKECLSLSLTPEVTKRASAIKQVHGQLASKFFKSPSIGFNAKAQVAQSIVFSRGCFQWGVWQHLTHHEYRKIHAAVLSVYRSIYSDPYMCDQDGLHQSDHSIISRAGVMHPRNILRLARLNTLGRLANGQHPMVVAVVCAAKDHKRSWATTVVEDIEWLASKDAKFKSLVGCDFVELVRRLGLWARFKQLCYELCSEPANNKCEELNHTPMPSLNCIPATCVVCGEVHPSHQALSVHMASKHGIKRVMRLKVDTAHCPCCMQFFSTRELVLAHLHEKSKRCFFFCDRNLLPLAPDRVQELDEADKVANRNLRKQGWKPHKQTSKVTWLIGPYQGLAHDLGLSHEHGLRGKSKLEEVQAALLGGDAVVPEQ